MNMQLVRVLRGGMGICLLCISMSAWAQSPAQATQGVVPSPTTGPALTAVLSKPPQEIQLGDPFTWTLQWKAPGPGATATISRVEFSGVRCQPELKAKAPLVPDSPLELVCVRRSIGEVNLLVETTVGLATAKMELVADRNRILVIDSPRVYSTPEKLDYDLIVFRSGGEIRVENGTSLEVRAREIRAEAGAEISINGQGASGAKGGPVTTCPECAAQGPTTFPSDEAFQARREACLATPRKGTDGGRGSPGANILVKATVINGMVRCDARGGLGGPAGDVTGATLIEPSTGNTVTCPPGVAGAVGAMGEDGVCVVHSES
ncbi:hypothetical protein [Corallococcus exiguus]|uniref:hypothetical protein n=1 Tax=Corallococcus exiguus TaxID=83462 RepID=UPI0014949E32|nr:hypothetical protein [Corallococcus exiguus]NPD26460.1 hypothetical protein [Corallococcus exiguus]